MQSRPERPLPLGGLTTGYEVVSETLVRSNVLEVAGTAVLLREERFTGVEFAGGAAGTLGGVGAVEVGDMAISDITEPRNLKVS